MKGSSDILCNLPLHHNSQFRCWQPIDVQVLQNPLSHIGNVELPDKAIYQWRQLQVQGPGSFDALLQPLSAATGLSHRRPAGTEDSSWIVLLYMQPYCKVKLLQTCSFRESKAVQAMPFKHWKTTGFHFVPLVDKPHLLIISFNQGIWSRKLGHNPLLTGQISRDFLKNDKPSCLVKENSTSESSNQDMLVWCGHFQIAVLGILQNRFFFTSIWVA